MTEVRFNKNVFVKTLEAFRNQFVLETMNATLETEPAGDKFRLSAAQKGNGSIVQAFGSCLVKGPAVSVAFDIVDLSQAIEDAYSATESDELVLLVADGIWVKDPNPVEDDGA